MSLSPWGLRRRLEIIKDMAPDVEEYAAYKELMLIAKCDEPLYRYVKRIDDLLLVIESLLGGQAEA